MFTGQLQPAAFVGFVQHRAERLDVTASVVEATPGRVSVSVCGLPEMIEAFEMACSLGPLCCRVQTVVRRDG